jgi:hypothetical protein
MTTPMDPKHKRGFRRPYTGHRPSQINTVEYLADPLHLTPRRQNLQAFDLFTDNSIVNVVDWQKHVDKKPGDPSTVTISPYKKVVYNQFNTYTCACNAAAAAYTYALDRQGLRDEPSFRPSRLFLYYVVRAMYAKFGEARTAEKYEEEKQWLLSLPHKGGAPTAEISVDEGCDTASVCRSICFLGSCEEKPVVHGTAPVDSWPFYESGGDRDPAKVLWGDVVNDWRDKEVKLEDGSKGNFFKNAKSLGAKAPPPGAFHVAPRHRSLDAASPPLPDDAALNTEQNPLKRSELQKQYDQELLSNWKQCLENGYPIIVTFQLFSEYHGIDSETDYILKMPSAQSKWKAAHVVLIVGYNDSVHSKGSTIGCLRIQDSYGVDNGRSDEGCWWIPYAALTLDVQAGPKEEDRAMMVSDPWILEQKYYNY